MIVLLVTMILIKGEMLELQSESCPSDRSTISFPMQWTTTTMMSNGCRSDARR